MTPADAARVLAVAAAFDRRTVGELDAKAWADALDDLDPRDCAEAVRAHYRDSAAWCMPAHVRERVTTLRRARAIAAREAETRRELEAGKHIDKAAAAEAFREVVQPVMARLSKRDRNEHQARQVRCPFCEAGTGSACTVNGTARATAHPSRYEAVGLPSPVVSSAGCGPVGGLAPTGGTGE